MAFRSRRLPPELINELIKFVDGPACRKRLISTNILCYLLLHNTKRANCWRVDVSETTTRYGPNRLLALASVELHKSAAKFFYTLAFWGHGVVPQQVTTIQDFQEVTQPEQHLRYYISLNAGDEREAMRAFFCSQQVLETLSTRYHCQFRFIPLEDERCTWDLASVTFENGYILCENWDGLMIVLYNRLFRFILRA